MRWGGLASPVPFAEWCELPNTEATFTSRRRIGVVKVAIRDRSVITIRTRPVFGGPVGERDEASLVGGWSANDDHLSVRITASRYGDDRVRLQQRRRASQVCFALHSSRPGRGIASGIRSLTVAGRGVRRRPVKCYKAQACFGKEPVYLGVARRLVAPVRLVADG